MITIVECRLRVYGDTPRSLSETYLLFPWFRLCETSRNRKESNTHITKIKYRTDIIVVWNTATQKECSLKGLIVISCITMPPKASLSPLHYSPSKEHGCLRPAQIWLIHQEGSQTVRACSASFPFSKLAFHFMTVV